MKIINHPTMTQGVGTLMHVGEEDTQEPSFTRSATVGGIVAVGAAVIGFKRPIWWGIAAAGLSLLRYSPK